jgi:hypothetical protein
MMFADSSTHRADVIANANVKFASTLNKAGRTTEGARIVFVTEEGDGTPPNCGRGQETSSETYPECSGHSAKFHPPI